MILITFFQYSIIQLIAILSSSLYSPHHVFCRHFQKNVVLFKNIKHYVEMIGFEYSSYSESTTIQLIKFKIIGRLA